ncbi:synaptotagmin-like protein 2 isoform X2 [Octodon degus]|uniref:Synaptotagmin-like protein 2 n=1 Tax=Octodon degus TaxID=10160 RepID=A0A6P6EJ93_OCTDE|nr:synaptotagmin-like protein 2 isoform X2 [Octodon degus]
MSQETARKAPSSPAKQRRNPFNSSRFPEDHLLQQTRSEPSKIGSAGLLQISKEGELSESKEKSSIQDPASQNLEKSKQTVPADPAAVSQSRPPIPKSRKLIYKSDDLKPGDNQSSLRQRTDSLNARGTPRGILKRNSSSSSTDSETLRLNHGLDSKSKTLSPGITIQERIVEKDQLLEEDPSPDSLEPLKHVRFSAVNGDLPQGPGLSCGREVGEFSVLEPDRLRNGTEDSGDTEELRRTPEPSRDREPPPCLQSASSPSAAQSAACHPGTPGSVPKGGLQPCSEVLSTAPRPAEEPPAVSAPHAPSPEVARLGAEVSNNPADELSHGVEPEPPRAPDCRPRDHQQDGTSLKENGSKALSPPKVELKPVRADSTCPVEREKLLFEQGQDSDANIKPKCMSLSREDTSKEGLGVLQPLHSCCAVSQGNKTADCRQSSESTGRGDEPSPSTRHYPYNVLKGSDTEVQAPYNTDNIGSFDEEEPKLHAHEKHKGNSNAHFDSSTIDQESNLKDHTRSERKSQEENTSFLEASLEAQHGALPPGAANEGSLWRKPEVQPQLEAGKVPQNHVQREKYKRVRERISFWEGERAAGVKLTRKEATPSGGQEQPSAIAPQSATSQSVAMRSSSTDPSEYTQVTAKLVVLDEDDQVFRVPSCYSSNNPEETRPPTAGPSEYCFSVNQPDKLALAHNERNELMERLPVEDGLQPREGVTSQVQQHSSDAESGVSTLEKDRFLIGESSANFKVMSLRERMDEPNTEQLYNHSRFENLKKFWDLGTHSNDKDNYDRNSTTSQKNSVAFKSQKHKKLSDNKSSGKNTHEIEALSSQRNIMAGEEMEKFNSKSLSQALPDETTLPSRSPRGSTPPLARSDSSKDKEEKHMEWFATPVLKEEKYYSDQEIQESMVKTSAVTNDYSTTFNDTLQKLLSEALSPGDRPSGGKVCVEQPAERAISEDKNWLQKTDLADNKQEARGSAELPSEHVGQTVVLSAGAPSTEATGTSHSPLQTEIKPVTTRASSQPKEDRFREKEITENHNPSFYQKEITPLLPEGGDTLGNGVVTQKVQSAKCQLNKENLFAVTAEGSVALAQTSHLHRKGSFEDVASSPQDTSFSWDMHQDKASSSQREIVETIERAILPPKPALSDVNNALLKLLKEVPLSYPSRREVGPRAMKADFSEGIQTAGSPPTPLEVSPPGTAVGTIVPDTKDFHTFTLFPDTAHEVGSILAPQMSPPEQLTNSFVVTMNPSDKEPPEEVADTVTKTVTPPKSEFLEFSTYLEKLPKETLQNSSAKYEKDPGALSPAEFMGSTGAPRQAPSECHPQEIQETIERAEALSVTESAFDSGFQKLLKEIAEVPFSQSRLSAKEETPEESLASEQAMVLNAVPCVYQASSGALEMKGKSGLHPQDKQCDKALGGDEAVTDLPVDLCGSTSGRISGTPRLYVDCEIETTPPSRPSEHRESEGDIREGRGDFQGSKAMDESRNKQSNPLLPNRKGPREINKVTSSRGGHDDERSSDSDFSDGNTGSHAESWRNTSSSEEEPRPVLKPLERSAARKMPSKSLEDISPDSPNQAKVDNLPEELVRSAEDDQKADQEPDANECIPGISTVPSQPENQFSHLGKLKRMSKSVPAFPQDESDDRETDTASESSYQLSRHKKSPSSLTNLSSSSGMTSLSSVSGSVMSVYSGDFGNLEVKGSIQFALDYTEALKELHVFVAQCKNLAAADVKKQRSDPYVKTYLLPDKGKMGKKKTLVVKKTLNPVFNEILRYKVEKQILKTQKLNLSVWHRDTFKRNSFLGEVELDLETWDWDDKQNTQLKWYPLKRKTALVALEAENRGEMKLALQYVPEPLPGKKLPTTGEVHIWVKECFDLPLLRGSHLNSFVKCTILPDTSRKSRQKTRAVGKTNNPIFNHTMVYDGFRPEDLMEACVELTVWDHYKLTNQFLGGLRIGFGTGRSYGTEVDWMDSTSEEVALWEKMLTTQMEPDLENLATWTKVLSFSLQPLMNTT